METMFSVVNMLKTEERRRRRGKSLRTLLFRGIFRCRLSINLRALNSTEVDMESLGIGDVLHSFRT